MGCFNNLSINSCEFKNKKFKLVNNNSAILFIDKKVKGDIPPIKIIAKRSNGFMIDIITGKKYLYEKESNFPITYKQALELSNKDVMDFVTSLSESDRLKYIAALEKIEKINLKRRK